MAVETTKKDQEVVEIDHRRAKLPPSWIEWLKKPFGEKMPRKAKPRQAFGLVLPMIGKWEPRVVVFDADLAESTYTKYFRDYQEDGKYLFRHRFFEMGIAEQSMMATAGGMSTTGLIPFITSYAQFLTSRALDQARNTVDYTNLNVKIVASHAALSVGEDGPSHQSMEDLSNMCAVVNTTVLVPADYWEAARITAWAVRHQGPVYFRMPRCDLEIVTKPDDTFVYGEPTLMREGDDVAIVATGSMVAIALHGAEILAQQGIEARVYNFHTIKPINEEALVRAAQECGAIVTVEEHNIWGGLGSIVARVLMLRDVHVPMRIVAINNQYLTSGPFEHLWEIAGLTPENVAKKAREAVERKVKATTA